MKTTEKIRGFDFIKDNVINGCKVLGIEIIDEKEVNDDVLSDFEMAISFDDSNEDIKAVLKRVEDDVAFSKKNNDNCIAFHLKDHDTVDAEAFAKDFYDWVNSHSPWEKNEIESSPDYETAMMEIEGVKDLEKAYKDPDTYYSLARMRYFGEALSEVGQGPAVFGDTVIMYDWKTGKHYAVKKEDIDF